MSSEPSDTSGGARAIVAGHGDFATGILSAVAQISGQERLFVPLSNRGMSAADVERALREQIEAHDARVIFTDLPAGSCTMAARRIQRERPDLLLVTGANVATLLEYAFAAHTAEEDDVRRAVERGRSALAVAARPATPAPKPEAPSGD
jgi:PTS system N-acetylgalactosamine-specific IIA component